MSWTTKAVTGVALIGVVGVAGLVASERLWAGDAPEVPASVTTSTADVRRATIAERQFVTGTLGYSGSYVVSGAGAGTLTRLPAIGSVVQRGGALYEVDGKKVVLLYGSRPVWRAFTPGMTDGVDVKQLETNLRALGHGDGMTVDRNFTGATTAAIRRWQRANGITVTGTVPLGTVAFMPGAIRVSGHTLPLGSQVAPGVPVERGTSSVPAVNFNASTQQLGWIKVDDPVLVTLPDRTTRQGRISAIGGATTSPANEQDSGQDQPQAQTTVPVTVRLDGKATGFVDQATVQVAVVRATHTNVLTVPIAALNSVADGKYELVVVDGAGSRRLPVRTGLFDDLSGTVEVSGDGVVEGLKVQVPHETA